MSNCISQRDHFPRFYRINEFLRDYRADAQFAESCVIAALCALITAYQRGRCRPARLLSLSLSARRVQQELNFALGSFCDTVRRGYVGHYYGGGICGG